jgi:hypothetical protein
MSGWEIHRADEGVDAEGKPVFELVPKIDFRQIVSWGEQLDSENEDARGPLNFRFCVLTLSRAAMALGVNQEGLSQFTS